MSIERLIEKYGHEWTQNPPPRAETVILEGAIRIDEITSGQEGQAIPVIQKSAERDSLYVISSIETDCYEVDEDAWSSLHPFALAGAYTYEIRESGRPYGVQNTQYPGNDGYNDAPADGENAGQQGLTKLGYIEFERGPIVITEGKGFDVVLIPQNIARGQPVIQGVPRFFCARITGFSLTTY